MKGGGGIIGGASTGTTSAVGVGGGSAPAGFTDTQLVVPVGDGEPGEESPPRAANTQEPSSSWKNANHLVL